MLGLQLKLTPAQVKALLLLQHGHREWVEYRDIHGRTHKRRTMPLELAGYSQTLLSLAALERRGLVIWKEEGVEITEEGTAVCALIYKQALAITQLVEGRVAVEAEKEATVKV